MVALYIFHWITEVTTAIVRPSHIYIYIYIYAFVHNLDHRKFSSWLGTCSAPSHYLLQSSAIVNRILGNKLYGKSNQNTRVVYRLQNVGHSVPTSESVKPMITKLATLNWTRHRKHFVYAPSQWQTTLHCNVVCHWLGGYTKRSLMT